MFSPGHHLLFSLCLSLGCFLTLTITQINRLRGSAIQRNFLIIILCRFLAIRPLGLALRETITSCVLFSVSYLRKAAVSRVIKHNPLSSLLLSSFSRSFSPPFLSLSMTFSPMYLILPSFFFVHIFLAV